MIANRIVRAGLLAGAALAVVPGLAVAAQQQQATAADAPADAATPSPGDAAAAPPAQARADEIVVTGSRIARSQFNAPNPITAYDAANIQQSGNTNVTNFLQRVPALTGSFDSTQSAGYDSISRPGASQFGEAGLNELNLRNLGTSRTLVLVNGRRHVAGEPGTASVDISAIPTDLIERVDVLTAGASAIYGADGVSGVVNFILKRDFDGIAARGQLGISQLGDAGNRFGSVIAGRNFADGRGNITLAYEYNADDRVDTTDRKYLRNGRRQYIVSNPADNRPNDDPNVPDNVPTGDLRYAGESPYGTINASGTRDEFGSLVPEFRGDGQVYNVGTPVSYYDIGGDSTPLANYTGDLLPRIRRHAVNLLSHYDFSDAFKLSVEGKFVQVRATTFNAYSGNYPATLFIDNPYMPASIRDAAIAAGQTSVTSNRDNYDYARRGEDDRRRTYRGVIDATGRISAHATYDASFVYGRTDVRITKLNDRLGDRYTAALDAVTDPATGQPTCRSNLDPVGAAALEGVSYTTFTPGANSGCVPINTFGEYTANPASVAFFTYDDRSAARLTQSVANASVSGDFGQFFTLPGGPIGFAVGGEYRRETSSFTPSSYLANNLFYQYDEATDVLPVAGKFHVWEAFGEVDAPLLNDVPFAYRLSLGAAGRYSHYSTIGGTRTWQVNGLYAPVRDISFRGSYGKAVRAPNVGELYTPSSLSRGFVGDPCDINSRDNGSPTRAANCVTLLTGLGVDPATYAPESGTSTGGDGGVFGTFQGNPDLDAETARTWTAGVVLRPRFLRGLTVSADWYDIRLKGAISTPDAQTIVDLCVDQPTLDNVYCAATTRQQGTGRVTAYTVEPQNVSRFRTAGLDLDLDYAFSTKRLGRFDVRLVGGYLHRLDVIATPGAAVEDDVDQAGFTSIGYLVAPKWNATFSPTWTLGRVTLAYNLRWRDGQRRFSKATTDGDPDYAPKNLLRYRDAWLSDLQTDVAINDKFSLYGGVTNLTNEKPDVDAYDLPVPSLGRFLYVGARVRLPR